MYTELAYKHEDWLVLFILWSRHPSSSVGNDLHQTHYKSRWFKSIWVVYEFTYKFWRFWFIFTKNHELHQWQPCCKLPESDLCMPCNAVNPMQKTRHFSLATGVTTTSTRFVKPDSQISIQGRIKRPTWCVIGHCRRCHRRYRVANWGRCVTPEWPRRTADLHKSARGRSSHLLLGRSGGHFQV